MKSLNFSILVVFVLFLVSCATGSHIIIGKVRSPIDPSEVHLYLDPPKQFETIAIIEASSEVEISTQAAQDRVIQELKIQAAKIGANGVLITSTGNRSGDFAGVQSGNMFYGGTSEMKHASGRAIYVRQE